MPARAAQLPGISDPAPNAVIGAALGKTLDLDFSPLADLRELVGLQRLSLSGNAVAGLRPFTGAAMVRLGASRPERD